jgi:hypothetical protein
VNTRWIPTGLPGPYRAISVRPATIVGSANGRSMIELMIRLPGNSSRISTHATSVPITALIIATSSDEPSVTTSVWIAKVFVIELQNVPTPELKALTVTAASGISTTTLM